MRIVCWILGLVFIFSTPVVAQSSDPKAEAVIERVANAYGGERLKSLQSVSISSNRRLAWPGQGQTATLVEYEKDRLRKHFDLVREHGSVERWTSQNGNVYHQRFAVTSEGAALIDYFDMTVTPSERGGYWQWFSGDYRSADILLAHQLATSRPADLAYVGSEFYRGHLNDKISFSVTPETPVVTLYVSRKDGLIRRLQMSRDIGEVNILFSEHHRTDGVSHASESHIYVDDTLTEYLDEYFVAVNADVAEHIAVEDTLGPPIENVDLSEMTVEAVGSQAFLVGQGDYSLFVLSGEGVIGVNAYAGVKDRYDALLSHLQSDLPLTDMIATHHHSDHMDGLSEAAELGATLHVTEHAKAALARQFSETNTWQVQTLTEDDTVGALSVYVRPTSHAVQNALVYHPGSKALFQDDHYHGLRSEGAARVQPSAVEMYQIVTALDLDIDLVLSGHARKAEKWSVFAAAVTRPDAADPCPSKRPICTQ